MHKMLNDYAVMVNGALNYQGGGCVSELFAGMSVVNAAMQAKH